jgi:enoyl-CoA hydratase/carnithine racemase
MPTATQFEIDGAVARLTLDRPAKRNCANIPMLEEVIDHVATVASDDAVRVLTIRGADGTFCAGADLTMFKSAAEADDRATIDEFIGLYHEATRDLEELAVPVLAAVEGYALAGGIELMLATDVRLASTEATIGDQHANVGLVAGGGGTQRLVRQLPTAIANDLMYTGRRLSGAEALDVGLVSRTADPADFETELAGMEANLAEKSGAGQALTKHLMREGGAVDLERGLQLERHAVIDYYLSDDALEGLTAFAEGREPEF